MLLTLISALSAVLVLLYVLTKQSVFLNKERIKRMIEGGSYLRTAFFVALRRGESAVG
jgi:hypothetical protein